MHLFFAFKVMQSENRKLGNEVKIKVSTKGNVMKKFAGIDFGKTAWQNITRNWPSVSKKSFTLMFNKGF